MNREEFKEEMQKDWSADWDLYMKVLDTSMNSRDWTEQSMIIMEELAELSQEVSKGARGELDRYGLILEMIDVVSCLDMLMAYYEITEEEINKAAMIKTKHIGKKLGVIKEENNMANAKKCDRCGMYFDKIRCETGDFNVISINNTDTGEKKSVDLCPSCRESFMKWSNRQIEKSEPPRCVNDLCDNLKAALTDYHHSAQPIGNVSAEVNYIDGGLNVSIDVIWDERKETSECLNDAARKRVGTKTPEAPVDLIKLKDTVDLMAYEFNIDDEVITVGGTKGHITDICKCSECEKSGFYAITWVEDLTGEEHDITVYEAERGFKTYHRIGIYKFNPLDNEQSAKETEYPSENVMINKLGNFCGTSLSCIGCPLHKDFCWGADILTRRLNARKVLTVDLYRMYRKAFLEKH